MKIRRILASTALAGVLGLGAMTGASALDLGNIGAADKVATGLINNAKCSDVRGALDTLNATNGGRIYNKETTRNELVQNVLFGDVDAETALKDAQEKLEFELDY